MPIDPENAIELATMARKVGAEVVEGDLRNQSGSWQLGEVNLGEHLDRYRDQRLMLVFVPLVFLAFYLNRLQKRLQYH